MDELISIPLANGSVTHPDKLRAYFERVIAAEQSGKEFPVSLDDVWRIGYAAKAGAVKALRKNFVKDVDYQSFIQLDEREVGATTVEVFQLSVSCLEFLAVRANRDVFEVYRACRKILTTALAQPRPLALPNDMPSALRQLADSLEEKARLQHQVEQAQQQAEQARPKVAFFDAVAAATNCIPMASAAAVLKLPGVGRNLLFRMLRRDGILKRNNAPMQQFINQGYFEVEPNTYDAGKDGEKGKRLATITRVTPRGLQWLSKKYQPQP